MNIPISIYLDKIYAHYSWYCFEDWYFMRRKGTRECCTDSAEREFFFFSKYYSKTRGPPRPPFSTNLFNAFEQLLYTSILKLAIKNVISCLHSPLVEKYVFSIRKRYLNTIRANWCSDSSGEENCFKIVPAFLMGFFFYFISLKGIIPFLWTKLNLTYHLRMICANEV